MDYEKAYKDALERMKSWARGEHPECFTEAQKAAEFIFPELAESEDEKISREITEFILTHRIDEPNDIEDTNSWLAWLEKQAQSTTITIPKDLKGTDTDGGVVGEKGEEGEEPQEQDGFEAELNALLKKYEHLPKHELVDSLEFYLWVVEKQSIKERLMEGAKPETLEEKVEHWQRMRDIAMEKIKGTFKEEDSLETKVIKEQIENLKKRIEDNQLGCIVQRLDKIIELLQSAILILPEEPRMPPIIYKGPLDPDPNVLGGWTTTASTFGSDYDIDTDKIKQDETSKPKS